MKQVHTGDCPAAGESVGAGALDVDDPESVKHVVRQGAGFFSFNCAGIFDSAPGNLLKASKGE